MMVEEILESIYGRDYPEHLRALALAGEAKLTAAEKRIIIYYTGEGHRALNNYLRQRRIYRWQKGRKRDMPLPKFKRLVGGAATVMVGAFQKFKLLYPITVYRGTILEEFGNMKTLLGTVGKSVRSKSFFSTAMDQYSAQEFDGGIMWSIQVPAGMHIIPVTPALTSNDENEVIFAPNARFHITRVNKLKKFRDSSRQDFYLESVCVGDGIGYDSSNP